jgi:hypothetical protein
MELDHRARQSRPGGCTAVDEPGMAKVIAIALLGYLTLWNRPVKRLLVRVLSSVKPLDVR